MRQSINEFYYKSTETCSSPYKDAQFEANLRVTYFNAFLAHIQDSRIGFSAHVSRRQVKLIRFAPSSIKIITNKMKIIVISINIWDSRNFKVDFESRNFFHAIKTVQITWAQNNSSKFVLFSSRWVHFTACKKFKSVFCSSYCSHRMWSIVDLHAGHAVKRVNKSMQLLIVLTDSEGKTRPCLYQMGSKVLNRNVASCSHDINKTCVRLLKPLPNRPQIEIMN